MKPLGALSSHIERPRTLKYWLLLIIAAAFEVGWIIGIRSLSTARPVWAVATIASYILSFVFLHYAVRGIPLGVAYAVWTGIGVVGAFAFAATALNERTTPLQLLFAGIVLAGVIGLYATTQHGPSAVNAQSQSTP